MKAITCDSCGVQLSETQNWFYGDIYEARNQKCSVIRKVIGNTKDFCCPKCVANYIQSQLDAHGPIGN